ncbi:hypothetical protein DF038_20950 [Burkholderia cepacia]|nr:hypothetical protein [Burkholderia sp. COPS]RQT67623.1 hypothetical protein DF045_29015 [Burkholderia cepacia]RQT72542.1 hypothetical protein DF029_12405 [Burkholderia cepacia]RRA21444.1 hypothetical protein DF038_20950 [Burkholderia cepacia]
MRNLLFVTPKVLMSTPAAEWRRSVGPDAILFTGADTDDARQRIEAHVDGAFSRVHTFCNYEHNDLPEKRAHEIHTATPLRNVVSLSEVDVLRTARIRERCGIPGHSEANAWIFRDKLLMKERARAAGLGTPRFARVESAFDLLHFVRANGLPVIVRPISGRGSAQVGVLRTDEELEAYLASGAIAATDFRPQLFVETFCDGPMFRIDGLVLRGEPAFMQVAKYINTTLDFMKGQAVGTYSLPADDAERLAVEEFVTHLVGRALPSAPTMMFHAQLLQDRHEGLMLCEIAARIGGGAINDEIIAATGVDLKMEYVRCCCLPGYAEAWRPTLRERLAARILLPPQPAVLEAIPKDCDIPWVVKYTAYGQPGRAYNGPAMTNAEVASFVYHADTVGEVTSRWDKLVDWHAQRTIWRS